MWLSFIQLTGANDPAAANAKREKNVVHAYILAETSIFSQPTGCFDCSTPKVIDLTKVTSSFLNL